MKKRCRKKNYFSLKKKPNQNFWFGNRYALYNNFWNWNTKTQIIRLGRICLLLKIFVWRLIYIPVGYRNYVRPHFFSRNNCKRFRAHRASAKSEHACVPDSANKGMFMRFHWCHRSSRTETDSWFLKWKYDSDLVA